MTLFQATFLSHENLSKGQERYISRYAEAIGKA